MKKLILSIIIAFPLLLSAQAHLSSTESEIKRLHPDKIFTTNYTNSGQKYISTKMKFGYFAYFFDSKTNLTTECIQVAYDLPSLNAQIEIYNRTYVIISDTQWKAYLNNGGIINIELEYDSEHNSNIFTYTD
jgi:hypothetical protein